VAPTVSAERRAEYERLVERFLHWAGYRPDILWITVVGSWARGEARMDSDVGAVVLTSDVPTYFPADDWVASATGEPAPIVRRSSGSCPRSGWLPIRSIRGPARWSRTVCEWCTTGTVSSAGSRRPCLAHPPVVEQTNRVADLVERLTALWTEPLGDQETAVAAFGRLYADPVVVNGTPMSLVELVDRARALQGAFSGLSMQVVDRAETPDRLMIAFFMHGRHVGSYPSPLGDVPPSGRDIRVRTIDVLTRTDGLISAIWVAADDLGLLTQLDAVRPAQPR
jgi:hypothetical protein